MGFFFLWYNVVFTIPLLVFFALLILQVVGFGLDNLFDLDVNLPGEGANLSEVAFLTNVLFFFNADKVATGLLVLTFMGTFGVIGLVFNAAARPLLQAFPSSFLVVSIPVAVVGAIGATKAGSSVLAKYFPSYETYGGQKQDLQGTVGAVISGQVDEKGGRAHVKDQYNNLVSVFCEMLKDQAPVPKGGKVLLVEYDQNRDVYLCSAGEDLYDESGSSE